MSTHESPSANRLQLPGGRLAFGGDYNPEQWPEQVWAEDVTLMREAGVTLVTVGVFSWALLQPGPERFEFAWLDRVLGMLHDNGIAVDLATATASPPPWLTAAHPEMSLVDADGVRRTHGARQAYCPSSPVFRAAAARLASGLVERYGDHPAVVLWHVSNEYACHNWHCYCEVSAAAFRSWLRGRYATLDALNEAWGTTFWSQRYTAWEQILPPRAVAYRTFANPTQQLDWWRFGSAEQLALFDAEAQIVRAGSDRPVTTNFMSFFKPLDYWSWSRNVDIVSNDDYLIGADPAPHERAAMSADLMRSLSGNRPWLLMEHAVSAVNWQPRNVAKAPGQLRRDALQYVAHGSDGALFFQWRASHAGAEKFHSALVPHAGTDTQVFREVCALGADLAALAEVAGSSVEPAPVAIVHDWQSWWAAELDSHPSTDLSVNAQTRRWYGAFRDRGIPVEFARPGDDLQRFRLVVLPALYLVGDADAESIAAYVRAGGAAVVTYFSGIVDEHDHIRLGGYPGAFRDLLGVRIEEFAPLLADQRVGLSDGSSGRIWAEFGAATTAEVLASYADGMTAGAPALTVADAGAGRAWYLGTEVDDEGFGRFVDRVVTDRGIEPLVAQALPGLDACRRTDGVTSWLFLTNHSVHDTVVPVSGHDLLHDREIDGRLELAAGDAAVLRLPSPT